MEDLLRMLGSVLLCLVIIVTGIYMVVTGANELGGFIEFETLQCDEVKDLGIVQINHRVSKHNVSTYYHIYLVHDVQTGEYHLLNADKSWYMNSGVYDKNKLKSEGVEVKAMAKTITDDRVDKQIGYMLDEDTRDLQFDRSECLLVYNKTYSILKIVAVVFDVIILCYMARLKRKGVDLKNDDYGVVAVILVGIAFVVTFLVLNHYFTYYLR